MKRILFVDQSSALGGAELSLIDIAGRMPGAVVAVFEQGEFSERLRRDEIPFVILRASRLQNVKRSGGILADILAIPALLATARNVARLSRDFDVLYANTQKAMLVAALAGRFARKPVIWHLRDLLTKDHFSKMHIVTSVRCANLLIDRIIANSRATREAFVDAGGNPDKSVSIPNGIDPAPFDQIVGADIDQCRHELGLTGKKVAGVFSRLAEWKGQHVLIDAISKTPDWHGIIVGEALFQSDAEYAAELTSMVESRGLTDRVHFLGFRDDVPTLMSACDAVVHTSTSDEPFGRVIVEGMLARTPVVASDGGGAAEIIDDGATGFLFEPADSEALANLLLQIERRDLDDVVQRAHNIARDRYGVDRLYSEVKQEIDQVCS